MVRSSFRSRVVDTSRTHVPLNFGDVEGFLDLRIVEEGHGTDSVDARGEVSSSDFGFEFFELSGDVGSEFTHGFVVLRFSDFGFEGFVNGASPLDGVGRGDFLVVTVSDGVVDVDSGSVGVILFKEFFETFGRSEFLGIGFGGRSTGVEESGLLFRGEESLRGEGIVSEDIDVVFKLTF